MNVESVSPPWHTNVDDVEVSTGAPSLPHPVISSTKHYKKSSAVSLLNPKLYKQENWLEEVLEALFHLKRRKTNAYNEIYCGFIHYMSSLYCLTVVPQQLKKAGYESYPTIIVICFCMGVGSILCGLFSNLPFVVAPPTTVVIFFSGSVRKNTLSIVEANIAVMITGALLLCLFVHRPVGKFVTRLIPTSIQVGTAIGVGLLTCLAGSMEIDMVVTGHYSILSLGNLTSELYIALAGVAVIVIGLQYQVKSAYCFGLLFSSFLWWFVSSDWPKRIFGIPYFPTTSYAHIPSLNEAIVGIMAELLFISILYLNGLVISFGNLAQLTKYEIEETSTSTVRTKPTDSIISTVPSEDSTISERNDNVEQQPSTAGVHNSHNPSQSTAHTLRVPRSRWVFIICGIFTIIGGYLSGPPMLVSPESGAAINAGAKTGLSAIVCGILILLSVFVAPLYESTPSAGTAPLLIVTGLVLFQNCSCLDWKNVLETAPAYIVLFYIPFTYSTLTGIILGYLMFFTAGLLTGRSYDDLLWWSELYMPNTLTPLLKRSAQWWHINVLTPWQTLYLQRMEWQLRSDRTPVDSKQKKRPSKNNHERQVQELAIISDKKKVNQRRKRSAKAVAAQSRTHVSRGIVAFGTEFVDDEDVNEDLDIFDDDDGYETAESESGSRAEPGASFGT